MRFIRSLCAVAFLSTGFGTVASSAGDTDPLARMLGTLAVHAEPYMADGKLSGCQYVFEALTQDWVYRKGQILKVNGSISVMNSRGKVGAALKVVVNEVSFSSSGELRLIPEAPSRAYLIGEDYETNLSALAGAQASDVPGALFSVFNIDPTLKIMADASQSNKVTVAFNRKGGDSDILLPLELDVSNTDNRGVRVRSNEAGLNFAKCTLALFKDNE